MTSHSLKIGAPIVVVVDLTAEAGDTVLAAAALARGLDSKLVLVHAFEHPFARLLKAIVPTSLIRPDALLRAEEDKFMADSARLEDLRHAAGAVPSEAKLVTGRRTQAILKEVARTQAALIVVGGPGDSRGVLLEGLTTASGLAFASSVPVLVIPHGKTINSEKPRIMIADDLRDTSLPAVAAGLELALAWPAAEVLHVHVNTVLRETFVTAMDHALLASSSGDKVSSRFLYETCEQYFRDKLAARGRPVKLRLQQRGSTIDERIVAGEADDEIEREAIRFRADLLVVGRHSDFHAGSVRLGRMPFRTMMALGMPVLIVPDAPLLESTEARLVTDMD